MLQSIRRGSKSIIMRIFLITLAIGFALWGIDDVFNAVGNDNAVEVGSIKISAPQAAREFDRARLNFMANASTSEAVAAGLLSSVVSNLARSALYEAEAERMNLTVTREWEKIDITNEPSFQDETNRFSVIHFQDALARANLTEGEYLNLVRSKLMHEQLMGAISAGLNYPDAITEAIVRWRLERRVIRHASIAIDGGGVPAPDDAAISEWYSENSDAFDSPDLRFITVAIISPESFIDEIDISEQALIQEYNDRRTTYEEAETRDIQQMIFADSTAANTAIERLANGEDFSAIAADMLNLSQTDVNQGVVERQDLYEGIAQHVFDAKTTGVLEPISTPFGYHVVNVLEIIEASIVPFDDVRAELLDELGLGQAINLVYDRITLLEDAIAEGQTIEEAAQSSGAELMIIDGMDRNGFDADGIFLEGIVSDTAFRINMWQAPIGDVSLIEESGADTFYIGRVDREEPARSRPLDEVKQRVVEEMQMETAINNARTQAVAITDAPAPATAAREHAITFTDGIAVRRDGVGFDHPSARLVAGRAFEIEPGAAGFIETGSETVLIIVEAIEPALDDVVAAEVEFFSNELGADVISSADFAMARHLEQRFDLHINPLAVQQLLIGGRQQ